MRSLNDARTTLNMFRIAFSLTLALCLTAAVTAQNGIPGDAISPQPPAAVTDDDVARWLAGLAQNGSLIIAKK